MKRLIYQVQLGKESNSKLYKECIQSVDHFCQKHDIEHYVQRVGKLKIKPDVFTTNRSENSYMKHGGFLPIYEKENAFDLLDDYDQIAIIDADIYIREWSPNIFNDMHPDKAFGCVFEREMPITPEYQQKIINYSRMQYGNLQSNATDFSPNSLGFEFANMGMIVLNCKKFKPYLQGQTAKEFISRPEFKDFVDGQGAWKWSTDQTLLNYFLKKYKVPVQHLHWKWNGLYGANTRIKECDFVHFFLKDLLDERGENIEELLGKI
jgi:hypothetical protein